MAMNAMQECGLLFLESASIPSGKMWCLRKSMDRTVKMCFLWICSIGMAAWRASEYDVDIINGIL